MYYPYLRGRQYELIALREMLEHGLLDHVIIPIIEPVKASPTLLSTLQAFIDNKKSIVVIRNPLAGSFSTEISRDEKYKEKFNFFVQNDVLIPAFIVEPKSAHLLEPTIAIEQKKVMLISNSKDAIPFFKELQSKSEIKAFIIPDESSFRRNVFGQRVLFSDRFHKKNKNASYKDEEDEFFSDDHRFYNEDGYIGFSDFSVIGDEYIESGFAPYAVAIHMVYFDSEKNLRIHHFVSDTNDDINDPAGKFSQALSKLVDFEDLIHCDTYGFRMFRDLYERQEYPGLGTVKKLSLMHHFELMTKYFDDLKQAK